MEPFAPTVEYDLPCLQFLAAPKNRRVRARRKRYKDKLRSQRNIGDARQILFAAQQLQVMERCPGQMRLELALIGNEKIDPHRAQARLVVIGIAPGSRCGGCAPTLRLPRRLPSDTGCDRNSPPGALPIASSPLRAGDGRCYSRRPPRQSCTKPLPAQGSPPEPELPPASPRCRGRSWRGGRSPHAGSIGAT